MSTEIFNVGGWQLPADLPALEDKDIAAAVVSALATPPNVLVSLLAVSVAALLEILLVKKTFSKEEFIFFQDLKFFYHINSPLRQQPQNWTLFDISVPFIS